MIFSFAGYEMDTDRIEFRHEGEPVHVEPQVFDVLRYLIEHRDRVVGKIELFDQVWGGAFVGESALTSRIKSARRLVGDTGQSQQVIRTVHRRGYQFVADVLVQDAPEVADAPGTDAEASMPSGTVSFLFSDIEGSSRLWEEHPQLMGSVIARHDELLRRAVDEHDGVVFATLGDGMAAAFQRASDAVAAARLARASIDGEAWPEPVPLGVRLGVHTGEAIERGGDYLGTAVNRAARVMGAAHGGQTLISEVTAGLLGDTDGLTDLGMCQIDPSMPSLRLWQLDGPAFPPLSVTVSAALPRMRTELIGRDQDLERVGDEIAEHRLVSIVGPGGAGKTTLALASSHASLASYPAGVVFVELASIPDGLGIARAVAEAAGIEGTAAADVASLATHLGRRSILLVLDNCEHLLDECAEFVDAVLDAGDGVSILTTSREPLEVDGEVVVPLGSLAAFAPTLFADRARAAAPDIEVDAADPRVEELCRRLDGLPLAIELAAAQLRSLGLDDLITRLDESLELSQRGRARRRGRHATLEQTIAWSYELLDDDGTWLLRQFGVFPGSFDLDTAEAVGRSPGRPSPLVGLSDLLAKSLMIRDPSSGRYRLLETIRAFARRRLAEAGEAEAAAERLRCHVVERACARSRLDRWFSGELASRVRADMDNVRFAFDRSMEAGAATDALEIHLGCCYLFRNTLSAADGRRWVARLEPLEADLDPVDRLWAVLARADLAQGTADHRAGVRAADELEALAVSVGDPATLVIALHHAALQRVVSAPDLAQERFDEALELASEVSDQRLVHLLRAFSAVTALAAGDVERGSALADSVGHEVSGDGYEVFISHWAAWTAALIRGDAAALRYWQDRQRHHLLDVGGPDRWLFLWSAGLLHAMEGDDHHDDLVRARERADAEGHDVSADLVLALAVIERLAGRSLPAAELLGSVMGRTLNNLSHYVLARSLRTELDRELGHEVLAEALARGRELDPESVLSARGLGLPENDPAGRA